MSLFVYLFISVINLRHRKFFTAYVTELQCLSTINMVFSDEDKILIKTHKYAQHICVHRGIKIGALKMQYFLNICRKFEFLISHGNVATYMYLR